MQLINRFYSMERRREKKEGGSKCYTVHTFGINLLEIGLELSGIARDARNDTIHLSLSLSLPPLPSTTTKFRTGAIPSSHNLSVPRRELPWRLEEGKDVARRNAGWLHRAERSARRCLLFPEANARCELSHGVHPPTPSCYSAYSPTHARYALVVQPLVALPAHPLPAPRHDQPFLASAQWRLSSSENTRHVHPPRIRWTRATRTFLPFRARQRLSAAITPSLIGTAVIGSVPLRAAIRFIGESRKRPRETLDPTRFRTYG